MNHSSVQTLVKFAPVWSDAHAAAAVIEGWNILGCSGSANGPWQIQRLDDASDIPGAPQLEADEDAWRLVLSGGKEHHGAALSFIEAHNPLEYAAIMAFGAKSVAPQAELGRAEGSSDA